jgi:ribA/ribD-fused uncharacterized protein
VILDGFGLLSFSFFFRSFFFLFLTFFNQGSPPLTISHLQELVANRACLTYFHFYGHTAKKPHVVDKSCFSQWFIAPFVCDGITYRTAEHFMMAEKARLFGDNDTLDAILTSTTPSQAKSLGREVKNFDEEKWCAHRFEIVVKANYLKFSQNENLKIFLLKTKTNILVEASPHDRVLSSSFILLSSHHITSHHITSHHITSHHITSHHITSHHITSQHNTTHHIQTSSFSLPTSPSLRYGESVSQQHLHQHQNHMNGVV